MKLVVYKVSGKKAVKKRSNSILLERILFISCIAIFAILIGVQGLIINPSTSTFLSVNSELDGTPLQTQEILYRQGELELCMENDMVDDNLKVLLNGEEIACFNQSALTIRVKSGDVVELDGSNSAFENNVYVKRKSDNIENIAINKSIKVGSGIVKLGKINIK